MSKMGATSIHRIGESIQTLASDLIRFVYPPECLVCEEIISSTSPYYCERCLESATLLHKPLCFYCKSVIDDVRRGCPHCRTYNPSPISLLWAVGVFDQFHRPIVHGIKYSGLDPLGTEMGETLATDRIGTTDHIPEINAVIPIPLHWSRAMSRGFNQSEIIARPIAEHLGASLECNALKRVRRTSDQTGLNANQRRANMRKAFEIVDPDAVHSKRVLLVDDVTTTGATLEEAATELRLAGCKNVYAAVVAVATLEVHV
jgi:ComF family protein